jgi:ketosteroid isomerase-like protein
MKLIKTVFLVSLFSATAVAFAFDDALFKQIKDADTRLFTAFNTCDLNTMSAMFNDDLEFYHDVSGLTDKQATMRSSEDNCARKVGLTRTLVEGSMKVYSVKDFGAMQLGSHRFCQKNNGVDDCGTFNFAHVWKQADGEWQVYRVLSYDH